MFGAITALSGIGGSGGEREDCDDEDPAHVSPLAPPRQTRAEAACSGMTFWFLCPVPLLTCASRQPLRHDQR